jgi:hypothetical protein
MNITFTPAKAAPPAGPTFTTSGINGITPKSMSEAQIKEVQGIFKAFQEKLVPTLKEGSEPQFDNITEMNFKSGMIIGSVGGKARYVHVSVLTPDLQTEYQEIQSKLQEEFDCKKEKLNPKILDPNSSTSPVLNTQRTAPRGWMRPSLDLSTLGLNTWFSDKADARFEYYSQQKDSKRAHLNRGSGDPVYIHNEALQFFNKEKLNLERKYASVWCSDPNDSSIQMKIAEEARDRAAEFVVFLGGSNGDRLHLYYEVTSREALTNNLDDRLMKTPFEKAMERKEPAAIPTAPTASMVHRIGAIAGTLVGGVRKLCEGRRVDAPASGASSPGGRGSSSSSAADEGIVRSLSDVSSHNGSGASLDVSPGVGAALASTRGAAAAEGAEPGKAAQEAFLSNLAGKVTEWQEQAKELLQNKKHDPIFRNAILTAFAETPGHQVEIGLLFEVIGNIAVAATVDPYGLNDEQRGIIKALRKPIYEPDELEEAWKSDSNFMVKAINIYPWLLFHASKELCFDKEFFQSVSQIQHPRIEEYKRWWEQQLEKQPGAVGIREAAATPIPTRAALTGTELWLSKLTMDQLEMTRTRFDVIDWKQGEEGALKTNDLIKRVGNEGLATVFKDNQDVSGKLLKQVWTPDNTGWLLFEPSKPNVSHLLCKAEWGRRNPNLLRRVLGY